MSDDNKNIDEIKCPYCAEKIKSKARKCKHCGEMIEPQAKEGAADIKTNKWYIILVVLISIIIPLLLNIENSSEKEPAVGVDTTEVAEKSNIAPTCGSNLAKDELKGVVENGPYKNSINVQLLDIEKTFEIYNDEKNNIRECIANVVLNTGTTSVFYKFFPTSDGTSFLISYQELEKDFFMINPDSSPKQEDINEVEGEWESIESLNDSYQNNKKTLTIHNNYATYMSAGKMICRVIRYKPTFELGYCHFNNEDLDLTCNTYKGCPSLDILKLELTDKGLVLYSSYGEILSTFLRPADIQYIKQERIRLKEEEKKQVQQEAEELRKYKEKLKNEAQTKGVPVKDTAPNKQQKTGVEDCQPYTTPDGKQSGTACKLSNGTWKIKTIDSVKAKGQ